MFTKRASSLYAGVLAILACLTHAADRASVAEELRQRTGAELASANAATREPAFSLPPGVSLEAPLTVENAVAIALWNNTVLAATLANLGLTRADIITAGILKNPVLQMLLPVGAKPFEMLLQLPTEVFWQRPRRVEFAQANARAVGQGLVQNGLDLVRDVRVAYNQLEQASNRLKLLTEMAALRKDIDELTRKRFEGGDISEYDANLATLDAKLAEEASQRAAYDVTAAQHRLRMLMGMRGAQLLPPIARTRAMSLSPPLGELITAAHASRPDLRAAELAIEAAMKKEKWERSRALNFLLPALSTKGIGNNGILSGPALAAEIPIFDRNQGNVARATAEIEKATRDYLALRDRVELEVRVSHTVLQQAIASVNLIRVRIVPMAQDEIGLARKAFEAGNVSYLSTLEATRQLYDARLREIESQAAAVTAQAELNRSIGK